MTQPLVRIELYEMARLLAGVETLEVEAHTLGEALAAVRAQHPALDPQVIVGERLAPHWRVSRNGGPWIEAPETPLEPGDTLVLVSALAGG